MKKLILLLLLLPSLAYAAPEAIPYDPQLSLMYRTLTASQQTLFDRLYDAAAAGTQEVLFNPVVAYDDLQRVMTVLQLDCPELCALSYNYVIDYYRNKPDEATGITLSYDLPIPSQTWLIKRAQAMAQRFEGDEAAIALQAHDLVCDLTDYTADAESPHTAYGALMAGQAVCDGYAKAYSLLLRLCDLPCSMLSGTVPDAEGNLIPHSWSLLLIDGQYTLCDVTWDDREETYVHNHCFVTDAQLPGHVRDAESMLLPEADVSLSIPALE